MKRIVFGGFCMVSGALLFGLLADLVLIALTDPGFGGGWGILAAVCAQIAGIVLMIYGFFTARQDLWTGD